jgi:hypothetical protein
MTVGKIQIEKHDRRWLRSQRRKSIGETAEATHMDWSLAFNQAQPHQIGITRIVFDQQNLSWWSHRFS